MLISTAAMGLNTTLHLPLKSLHQKAAPGKAVVKSGSLLVSGTVIQPWIPNTLISFCLYAAL